MLGAELSVVYLNCRRWWANKLRAVTRTRQAQRRCSVVVTLMIATAVMLSLMLPLDKVTRHHLRDKQSFTTCSLDYYFPGTFTAQNSTGFYRDGKLIKEGAPPEGVEPPSRFFYNLSTSASRADPHTVAVECWFTKVDLAFTTIELTCMTTIWGEYAKQPSLGRVDLPNTSTLVVSINGANAMVLNDTDTPGTAVTSVAVYAGPSRVSGASSYPDLSLPFQVLVSVFLQNSTNCTSSTNSTVSTSSVSGGDLSYCYGPLWQDYIVWLWHSYMPMYQVRNDICTHVSHRNYTVVLTGEITLDTLSHQLLQAMSFMMWCVTVMDFALTVMLYVSRGEAPLGAKALLTFSTTLLFALPTMRAIWPAAPPSSTRLDVTGIFAQLMLVSFAVIAQLLYLALWQPAGSTVVESSQLPTKEHATGRQRAQDPLPLTQRRQLTVPRSQHGAPASLDDAVMFEI